MNKAQVQPVKAYFVVEMKKFVCCSVKPNCSVKVSQILKVKLSARTHDLIKDQKSLKRQIILNIVKGLMKVKSNLVFRDLGWGTFFMGLVQIFK